MKKIVVMNGSFNPVTVAHYQVMSDAVEKIGADEGVFVITNHKYLTQKNLLKVKVPSNFILSESMRTDMLNSLKSDNPKLSCWGVEIGGINPSTYKTLVKLYKDKVKQYPGEEIKLYFLFGADKLKGIPNWQNADEMINLCEYLVYARNFDIESVVNSNTFLTKYRDKIHFMEVEDDSVEDISSTEVRRRFFNNEDYSKLMNKGPYEIMNKLDPASFEPVTIEDIIKAHIIYGGQFGKNAARLKVYKANCAIFKDWTLKGLGDKENHRKAKVYNKEFSVEAPALSVPTATDCFNSDCVDIAEMMINDGYKPAILNLASRTSPCGGYHCGTNAQEESLAQMSTLSQSLYQFGNPRFKYIRESGLVNVPGVYPLDLNFGGIYSPCVTFFRNNCDNLYSLRDKPFDCPVITVASLSNREENAYTDDERGNFDVDGYLNEEGRAIETNKIRTIFRIALDNGNDSLVLGAFGCGVYNLHSDEVSALFKSVLEEPEFKNRFRKIVFAIYEGKVTSRNPFKGEFGKFKPFYDIFKRK